MRRRRAERLGATIVMRPEDIAGIARFTVIRDTLGAVLALMKPSPREEKVCRTPHRFGAANRS